MRRIKDYEIIGKKNEVKVDGRILRRKRNGKSPLELLYDIGFEALDNSLKQYIRQHETTSKYRRKELGERNTFSDKS